MDDRLSNYLDGVFSPYEDLHTVRELKEELLNDLQEKLRDLKNQGYDDATAYRMTIDSVGDIEEVIGSIATKTRELRQMAKRDLSMTNLQDSDLTGIDVPDGKFNYSALKGSDFSGSDLTNSSFKCSDLKAAKFDGANLSGAKLNMCALKAATFENSVLNNTDFSSSDLSGVSFDNQKLNGTIFDQAGLAGTSFRNAVLRNVSFRHVSKKDIRRAIFDGATMDKLTYAVLKGNEANLTNVIVI